MAVAEVDAKAEALKSLLECPICFEISRPPIFACVIGHLICKDCSPKVDSCPICRSGYTGTRNFTAEELYEQLNVADATCGKSQAQGTVQQKQPAKVDRVNSYESDMMVRSDAIFEQFERMRVNLNRFRDALPEDPDEFRPIKCCLFTDDCKNSMVDFFSYIDHLRLNHRVFSTQTGISSYNKRQNIKGDQFVRNGSSKMFIMNCFDRHFLISMHQDYQFVWAWVALHGSEEETEDFTARLTIKHHDYEDIVWAGKVHGIRKTVEEIGASNEFLKVQIGDLKRRLIKFGWIVQAQITRNIPNLEDADGLLGTQGQLNLPLPTASSALSQTQHFFPMSPQLPQLPSPPPRPPIPRSQSTSQIRQPVTRVTLTTKAAAPPVPRMRAPPPIPPLPPVTRISAFSNSTTAQTPTQTAPQLSRPRMSLQSQPQPFQTQRSTDERIRALINRTAEERPAAPLVRTFSISASSPTTSGYRPVTWVEGARASSPDIPRPRTASVPLVKRGKESSCVIS